MKSRHNLQENFIYKLKYKNIRKVHFLCFHRYKSWFFGNEIFQVDIVRDSIVRKALSVKFESFARIMKQVQSCPYAHAWCLVLLSSYFIYQLFVFRKSFSPFDLGVPIFKLQISGFVLSG